MTKPGRLHSALIFSLLSLAAAPVLRGGQGAGNNISSPEQIKAEFDAVPCQDKERLQAVKALFERMGAAPSEISVEKYKNVENLTLRKQGESEEKIIVGAHYDKVSAGCGALDNWTGVVALAHLYRTLKSIPLKKTAIFVAFGKEEQGLVGSQAMANAISKDQVAQYCAMINIDSLGLAAPQVMDNVSSEKLGALAEELTKEMNVPFGRARIDAASADSASFIRKKIPAVTIHGLTNEWPKLLHSGNDQPAKVNPTSVYLGYRLALALVTRIAEAPCQAFR